MPDLSVIVVNYNSQPHLDHFIPSLQNQSYKDFELIIVDNASTDNSLNTLGEEFPQARIFKNQKNLGYAKAVNLGIKNSIGKFILTLNFDLILESEFISEMLEIALSDPRVGSVSGKLFKFQNGEKTNIIDSAGHIMFKNRIAKNRGSDLIDYGFFRSKELIFGVSGAAALYRREMLEDIRTKDEYLDEDLIAGLDDVDLDWRGKLLGWKCYFNPEAVAYHVRGATLKRTSRYWRYLNYRNRYLLMIKNDTLLNFVLDLPFILICEFGLLLSMLFELQLPFVIAGLITMLPKYIEKRQELQKKRKVGLWEMRRWFK